MAIFGKKKSKVDSEGMDSLPSNTEETSIEEQSETATDTELEADDEFYEIEGKYKFSGKNNAIVLREDSVHIKNFGLARKIPYQDISYVGIGKINDKKSLWALYIFISPNAYINKKGAISATFFQKIIFKEKDMEAVRTLLECLKPRLNEKIRDFNGTRAAGMLLLDEEHEQAILSTNYPVDFGSIMSCDLLEDGISQTSGNAGKALVGGILLGPVGAIMGNSAKKKTTTTHFYSVAIKTNDINNPAIMSFATQDKMVAQSTMSALEMIIRKNEERTQNNNRADTGSDDPIEKIKKFKELLDMGIISQEEFDSKKKELLDL